MTEPTVNEMTEPCTITLEPRDCALVMKGDGKLELYVPNDETLPVPSTFMQTLLFLESKDPRMQGVRETVQQISDEILATLNKGEK